MNSINALTTWAEANPLIVSLILLWAIIWKGLALWKSAELRQKYWFIALLLLNTLGVLEIIYLFIFARKYKVEVVEE